MGVSHFWGVVNKRNCSLYRLTLRMLSLSETLGLNSLVTVPACYISTTFVLEYSVRTTCLASSLQGAFLEDMWYGASLGGALCFINNPT